MDKDAEIVRSIHIEDKIIEVHIHLSEDEIRRLLLPLVVQAFGNEVRRYVGIPHGTFSDRTTPL